MTDQRWLTNVYTKERKSLFLTAWNILHHAESSEDAVHAAFVKMSKLRTEPDNARLYAFKAVRNAAIDMARVKSRRPVHQTLDAAEANAVARPTSETTEYLETAIARLSTASREVVELHIHSGLSFREIGEMLDTPTQTIASRYRRALQFIKNAIEVEDHG